MAGSGYQPRPGAQGAWELFRHLTAGGSPSPIQSTLRLDSGEVLMDETAYVSIWAPTDVQYKAYKPTYVQGAPIWSLAAWVVNRHRTSRNRQKAAQEAAAQWRGPDLLRVVVTSQSAWWLETETGEWLDVPYGMIAEMRVDPYAEVTELALKSKPPLRFAGPWAAFAGILIAHFVYADQLAAVPGLGPFAAAVTSGRTTPLPQPPTATAHGGNWQFPHPAPNRTPKAVVVTAAAALLVVLALGLSSVHIGSTWSGTAAGGNVLQTSTPSDPAVLPLTPSVPPSPSPSPSPANSGDPLAGAASGDCYANSGTEDYPEWQLDHSCGSGDFKVVGVEQGTTDTSSACSGVNGWDKDYSDPPDDQVLCMAYQDSSPAYDADVNQCVFGPPGLGQTWNFTSCGTGNFTVTHVYRNPADPSPCGSDSDQDISFTVPGYPDLGKVLCLQMNFPWISTVQVSGCVWESGSGSDTSFAPVTSCSDANAVVEGRIFEPDDGSFCGQYAEWYWESSDYQNLGVTVCLGSPN